MKKITLIACALATAIASFATTRATKVLETSQARVAKEDVQINIARPETFKTMEAREAEVVNDTMFIPYYVPGTFRYGSNSRGVFYYVPAYLMTPYADSLTFYNLYSFESTWLAGGVEVAKDTAFTLALDGFGEHYGVLPTMQTPTLAYDDTTNLVFPDYTYGAAVIADLTAKYGDMSDWHGIVNGSCYLYPLTYHAVYTENEGEWYFPFDYGTYRAADGGDYWYGTKLVNSYTSTDDVVAYLDTMAVFVENPGVMYIDHVSAGIYTLANTYNDMFPGDDDHIRLTLYPVTETGAIDWENPIASATAGSDDVTGSSWTGIINFIFTEEDPITGAEYEVPAIVEGDFMAVFDEYNNGTANFGFFADDEMTTVSNTYFIFYYPAKQGRVITQKYRSPANLLVNFHAITPVVNTPEKVQFELSGGEKEFTVATNVWAEDMEIDADDWIDVEAATITEEYEYDGETYEEHTYKVVFTITVDPSDVDRVGTIEIDALGLPVTIKVVQGEDSEAVENVNASAAKVSKSFIDGQLIIERNGVRYNAIGAQISK